MVIILKLWLISSSKTEVCENLGKFRSGIVIVLIFKVDSALKTVIALSTMQI
ncbi:hypothetical protein C0J52_10205 [Blattella germanica]|nr:hypothetical protein C0J52_10205 [Blattella germanica]